MEPASNRFLCSRTKSLCLSKQAPINHEVLREHSFFKGRDPKLFDSLADGITVMIYLPGQDIIKEGEDGKEMFFLYKGAVDVIAGVGPDEKKVAQLRDGSLFGELAILGDGKRMCTIRASEVSDCRVITAEMFNLVLQRFPAEKKYFVELADKRLGKKADAPAEAGHRFRGAAATLAAVTRMKVLKNKAGNKDEQLAPASEELEGPHPCRERLAAQRAAHAFRKVSGALASLERVRARSTSPQHHPRVQTQPGEGVGHILKKVARIKVLDTSKIKETDNESADDKCPDDVLKEQEAQPMEKSPHHSMASPRSKEGKHTSEASPTSKEGKYSSEEGRSPAYVATEGQSRDMPSPKMTSARSKDQGVRRASNSPEVRGRPENRIVEPSKLAAPDDMPSGFILPCIPGATGSNDRSVSRSPPRLSSKSPRASDDPLCRSRQPRVPRSVDGAKSASASPRRHHHHRRPKADELIPESGRPPAKPTSPSPPSMPTSPRYAFPTPPEGAPRSTVPQRYPSAAQKGILAEVNLGLAHSKSASRLLLIPTLLMSQIPTLEADRATLDRDSPRSPYLALSHPSLDELLSGKASGRDFVRR